MANSPDVGVLYQALWRAGAVVTPATFLLPPEDLRHVVANAEASAVVTSPEFVDKVNEAVHGLDCVRNVISSGDVDADVLALSSLEQAPSVDPVHAFNALYEHRPVFSSTEAGGSAAPFFWPNARG